jgi:hypothetical protein
MARPIVARAKELKILGYDVQQSAKILMEEDNNLDIIEYALYCAYDKNLSVERPPRSYLDIKLAIQATLYAENQKEIIKVLTANTVYGCIITQDDAAVLDLETTIHYCRRHRSDVIMNEIHETLKPYFENMIKILGASKCEQQLSDNEIDIIQKWCDWFGLWTKEMQLNASQHNPNCGSIIHIESYEQGEYSYCHKYKTEINVNNICKFAACPFYDERYNERKCYF